MNLTGKGDDGNIQSCVAATTTVTPTMTVKSSLAGIYNKELISTTQAIFEDYSRTTRNPDLAAAL